jgi:hypothetical protein
MPRTPKRSILVFVRVLGVLVVFAFVVIIIRTGDDFGDFIETTLKLYQ